jgi:protein-export membrane protein SecD
MWKTRLIALSLLIVGTAIGFFVYSSETGGFGKSFPFKLGLDLKGGTHLVYKADVAQVASGEVGDAMDSLREVIERRVNLFGVSEPLVQTEQSSVVAGEQQERLIVELPGVTDVNEAIKMIGATPLLEFKLVKENADIAASTTPEDFLKNFEETGLTGKLLSRASLQFDPTTGQPAVLVQFNSEGKALFGKITEEHVGRSLAIFLDGQVISAPVIREKILDGQAQISGGFTPDEAKTLVRNLNYGALPVPIELISTQTIGASLGDEAVHRSVNAGLWGFIFVAIFLILWYRLPGVLAVIALSMYVVLNLALFKLIPVTLTAAGLAAFILSIGMAVDANILIFERMKEELLRGKNLRDAIKEGFARAWLSIRDSNLSSIITATILFWFGGTAIVKGFALVFAIGVITSMFTAITMTRTLLLALGFAERKDQGLVRFLFGNGFSK